MLLDELLELSRVGRQENRSEELQLSKIVDEALQLVNGHVSDRAVKIDVSPDLPVVFGDRSRLLQAYQNLFANAVKYMGDQSSPVIDGGVRESEEANGEANNGTPVFFVRDNGMGIYPRYHDKVFGLFERLDSRDEGTGVGLALVKHIIELHGGRIWVESEGLGRGSTFCFTLGIPAS